MKKYLALVLALALLLCAGCAAKTSSGAAVAQAAPMAPAEAPAAERVETAYGYDGFDFNGDGAALDAPASTAESAEAPMEPGARAEEQSAVAQKLIYRADMAIETLDFDAAVSALEQLAQRMGGFVERSGVSGNTRWQPDGSTRIVDRRADYVLRVPSERFQETIRFAGSLGSVTGSSSSVENITSQFIDQEARKHSLEVQEERLLSMLEKAEDVDTLVVLESRLSEVRYEIESAERQLRNWQQQVDYSTVSVSVQEVEVYTPTAPVQRSFGERISSALSDGWYSFTRGFQNFLVNLVYALPGLILFLVIVAAVVFAAVKIVRRILRRRKEKRAARQRAEAGPPAKGQDEPENP